MTIRTTASILCLFALGACCCEAVPTSYGYSRQAEEDREEEVWVVQAEQEPTADGATDDAGSPPAMRAQVIALAADED